LLLRLSRNRPIATLTLLRVNPRNSGRKRVSRPPSGIAVRMAVRVLALSLVLGCTASVAVAQTCTNSSPIPWIVSNLRIADSENPIPFVPSQAAEESCSNSAPVNSQNSVTPSTWGIVGFRGFPYAEEVAPNGLDYRALFALDLDFNLWLWQARGVYLFTDATFWAQKATPGITNAAQGPFDFSKRELDFNIGLAWNYYGRLEGRAFAYSFSNLNRGLSETAPTGYADGVGLENRIYLTAVYDDLGSAQFDLGRASFISLGFYPSKNLVDADGNRFTPGPFARAYLIYDLAGPHWYLFADTQLVANRSVSLESIKVDAGLAARPFERTPRLEFRIGSGNDIDPHSREWATSVYGAIRFNF